MILTILSLIVLIFLSIGVIGALLMALAAFGELRARHKLVPLIVAEALMLGGVAAFGGGVFGLWLRWVAAL